MFCVSYIFSDICLCARVEKVELSSTSTLQGGWGQRESKLGRNQQLEPTGLRNTKLFRISSSFMSYFCVQNVCHQQCLQLSEEGLKQPVCLHSSDWGSLSAEPWALGRATLTPAWEEIGYNPHLTNLGGFKLPLSSFVPTSNKVYHVQKNSS